jgi:hypothetical protein
MELSWVGLFMGYLDVLVKNIEMTLAKKHRQNASVLRSFYIGIQVLK